MASKIYVIANARCEIRKDDDGRGMAGGTDIGLCQTERLPNLRLFDG